MKTKLFENIGGNQFALVKGLEPVNEMPVGDAKRKRDYTPVQKLLFIDLLGYLKEIGVTLDKKQELELFKRIADITGWKDARGPDRDPQFTMG